MGKKNKGKDTKKDPAKTAKEKRQAKKDKKNKSSNPISIEKNN